MNKKDKEELVELITKAAKIALVLVVAFLIVVVYKSKF